ncbi:3-mercaptopyruvate sulfurtransferase SseA, contains two rhodanese domains [Thermosyntropha lipolytica DSM 11003]|uniref:3-mercaptopyruvate sulfurtransferase SseA, contains two rhodanese domains n=1 Tax=Thermosyntropha lipolytica DSM 11003 TaxID=1123382 RepID=A0A1M5LLZ6_9FIRM|nr:3-mercaptopyruvate sulfurtransferase SseA, contains two rhodanese domains [Thermosyntropha lipolytica DSM 11003]
MLKNMKARWLSLLLVMVLLSSLLVGCGAKKEAAPPVPEEKQAVEQVDIRDIADEYFAQMPENNRIIKSPALKERIDAGDTDILVIDIRPPEVYAKGHIKGAVNIPFRKMHEYLDKLPADKEIIIACVTGQTAGQAIAILNMYGYDAKSLYLGFDKGWVGENDFPVDTAEYKLPQDVTPAKPDPAIAQILKDYFANLPDNNNIIDPEELQKKIDASEDIMIVDIRAPEDYAEGHIKGAVNIPFRKINEHFDEFAQDKPVYVYCYTGQTAGQAIAVLKTLGIDAYSVKGGFKLGWAPAGLPVEK